MGSVEQIARELEEILGAARRLGYMYDTSIDLNTLERTIAALREQPEARGVVDGLPWELRQRAKHAGVVTGELLNKAADALDALTAAQQPVQEGGGEAVACPYRTTCTYLRACAFGLPGNGTTAPPSAPVGVEVSGYIATVPDNCDRIIWRGHYHHLPLTQQPAQAAPGANTEFARIGDMSPTVALRVGTDSDCDVYLSVTGDPGEGVEFCTSGPGGGKSPRTREALVALMDAIRQDNIEDPRRDWWARRNIPTPPGDDAAGGA